MLVVVVDDPLTTEKFCKSQQKAGKPPIVTYVELVLGPVRICNPVGDVFCIVTYPLHGAGSVSNVPCFT